MTWLYGVFTGVTDRGYEPLNLGEWIVYKQ